ncbi:transketolase signature 1 [Lucifera butyrica]|uniref:Transketolase signature 1 n=1 Tax=Lucifera butyrica TaxID=1351585 RepID=A0A498RIV0_9FIRM|nr:transketolase [Lucifera butyrica]VBB08948.1 transketolase signature 1 [Lucifera butyrica]
MTRLELEQIAIKVRMNIIDMIAEAGSGHPGGSLSIVDLLTVLYFDKMNLHIDDPRWEDRDRFILSKGHAAPGLYAVLAERGYFPVADLKSLRKLNSYLQGHPDMKAIPGVDMSTGSLGQGLSAANGMALAGKLDHKAYRVYVMIGDGELQEGQIWEAAMTAAHYKLDNLTAFVDCNGLQIDGTNQEVMNVNPITDKFAAFGWQVLAIDGHNPEAIAAAVEQAKTVKNKPTAIIAKTVKGKGVSFMENQVGWHGSAPNQEQRRQAMAELERSLLA